jgi:hypothetical protein
MSDIFHVFLDTSILFNDPFWQGNYAKQLRKAAYDSKVKIYISDVVILELKRNFEKSIDKEIFDINKVNQNLLKITRGFSPYEPPNKEKLISEFNNFYEVFGKKSFHKILNYNNDIMPIIVEKAINRKKPFTESKTELKDAIIWETYKQYIKHNGLNHCFLITSNTTDFCNPEKVKEKFFVLHDDLHKECDKIKISTSFQNFVKENYDFLYYPEIEFKKWIEEENIDEDYVYRLLWDNANDKVSNEIQYHIEKLDADDFFKDQNFSIIGGYLDFGDINWYRCSDIEVDINGAYAIVSGNLQVSCNIQAYGYNSVRDEDDEKYPFLGEDDFSFELSFNFIISKEKQFDDFEITDVYIV